ncbi:MAG TPA: hypothetical protein VGK73_11360 [Polyangiaceae bacterium]
MTGPINLAALQKAHKRFLLDQDRAVDKSLDEAGDHAAHHVKTHSKFKRRSAARSVKDSTRHRVVKTKGGKVVRITNSKKRGGYDVSAGLESGTRPHTIRAKGKVLRFRAGGRLMFRRSVQHPGTPAYRFLFNATNAANRFMGGRLSSRLSRLARRF